jgi:branched-subunit amino acid transport protein AzlD
MQTSTILSYIAVGTICTLFLRFLPFTVFSGKRELPDSILYLGKILPPAIMAVLIIYCLKDVPFALTTTGIPKLLAAGIVIITYHYKHSNALSILLGTISYMIL